VFRFCFAAISLLGHLVYSCIHELVNFQLLNLEQFAGAALDSFVDFRLDTSHFVRRSTERGWAVRGNMEIELF
jgi:hypothetical protein